MNTLLWSADRYYSIAIEAFAPQIIETIVPEQ